MGVYSVYSVYWIPCLRARTGSFVRQPVEQLQAFPSPTSAQDVAIISVLIALYNVHEVKESANKKGPTENLCRVGKGRFFKR